MKICIFETSIRHRYFQKKKRDFTRTNEYIRISPLRVIDEKGEQIGVISRDEALRLAREKGLDLVEISPKIRPPVVKIMDYGAFKYQKEKKMQAQKKATKKSKLKAVRISVRTEEHDLSFKAKQIDNFLSHGHKVKIEMHLRGRENANVEYAKEVFQKFLQLISQEFTVETPLDKKGSTLSMLITVKK